jgi:hypothetical protein
MHGAGEETFAKLAFALKDLIGPAGIVAQCGERLLGPSPVAVHQSTPEPVIRH